MRAIRRKEKSMSNTKSVVFRLVIFTLTLTLVACGSGDSQQAATQSTPRGDAAQGEELFAKTCAACHGPQGKGIEGLGRDMTTSEFIAEKSDEELAEFIKVGRRPDDPLNTTGVDMPPKGGNPSLTDEGLYDIVAFIRTIHE
jgi:disulfide bond formation protein DsbB